MDQEALVRDRIAGAQQLIDRLAQTGFPLTAAFWKKMDDDARWYLHIVTPLVGDRGPFEVYQRIREAGERCPWANEQEAIDTSMIKVLEPTHSLAKRVAGVIHPYPGPKVNTWYRAEWVGDAAVSGMYIYALPRTAPQPAGS